MARAPIRWRDMVAEVEEARRLVMAVIAMDCLTTEARRMLLEAAEKLNAITRRSE